MSKKLAKKPKKGAWFIQVRRSYLPCSWQGWLSYIPFTLLALFPIKYIYDTVVMCREGFTDLCFDDNNFLKYFTLEAAFCLAIYFGILYGLMLWLAKRKS